MNIFQSLLGGQNSQLVEQLAKQAGLDSADVQKILGQVLPALSSGIKQNTASGNGLQNLMQALQNGNHAKYLENPEVLAEPSATAEGNAILGHILGSKDDSRNLARHAAEVTGADENIVKKLLPLVAATAMGALSKKTGQANLKDADSPDLGNLLVSFLDTNNDGNITDDLFNIAKKLF
ncbi:DUF937 domain-containing protein [Methylomonas methanica]|uniref:DUF937 domain-containing protein n=1 Tax=Methylomonas methanica (strain DSM 25384 / MC09) TaxID=857087 RepID=F9ZYY2_METMM|nr:DUF937 domain-containing protein [Methylomonas methanica]AEF99837.1 Protein of unknown function DUF2302 [Methylomonas methanica MC09]